MQLSLVEPLRDLFKDEVGRSAWSWDCQEKLIWRHPPLALGWRYVFWVRSPASASPLLQAADAIFLEELWAANLYRQTGQALPCFCRCASVGVMGDGRTYANVVALRAVTTDDFMTAVGRIYPMMC